jgi:hypothetical protein
MPPPAAMAIELIKRLIPKTNIIINRLFFMLFPPLKLKVRT